MYRKKRTNEIYKRHKIVCSGRFRLALRDRLGHFSDMKCLADIGGTHLRLALADNDKDAPQEIEKFLVSDYKSFEAALEAYTKDKNVNIETLWIGTAAYEDGDIWKFVNNNPWKIDTRRLENQGWPVAAIMNDFVAAGWGVLALGPEDHKIVRAGAHKDEPRPRLLTGPGTGLGLAHIFPFAEGGAHVQRTHGGHMPAAALTEEQWLILQVIRRLIDRDLVVFENLVSGPGLFLLYKACCLMTGRDTDFKTARDVFENLAADIMQPPLRLFHEFFGIFTANAVVTVHAYGGVYLTGGVLERIMAAGLFDLASFEQAFLLQGVDSVKQDLAGTPVHFVTDPYLPLKGLMVYGHNV